MRELRLIGVQDDGEHLLLAGGGEDRFELPIDDALRTALRRTRPRPSADVGSVPVPDELRPRDVQALLRAGVSTEDVAERAGWTVEKVERYAGPIQAEREYIAGLARGVPVSGGTAGRADSTFGQRVERRLDGRGVAADDIVWDSWRGHDGTWTVICGFPAGGRQRQASWHFELQGRALDAIDDEARWLGEDDTAPGLLPRGTAHEASVYDVEAEGGLDGPRTPPVRKVRGGRTSATAVPSHPAGGQPAPASAAEPPVDLVAAMRERSKNRRRKPRATSKTDFPEDAAPLEQLDTSGAAPPVGSHPRPDEVAETPAPQQETPAEPSVDELGHDPVTGTADLFADLPAEDTGVAPAQRAADSEPDSAEATAASNEQEAPGEADEIEPGPETDREPDPEPTAAIPDRPSTARKGRPSVPSWDDIMFGRRPGRD